MAFLQLSKEDNNDELLFQIKNENESCINNAKYDRKITS